MGWREKALLSYLWWHTRPTKITSYLRSMGGEEPRCKQNQVLARVRVASVQGELTLLNNPLDYVEMMYLAVREAYHAGAHLVTFPEDNATHLLGLIPGIEEKANEMETLDPTSDHEGNLVEEVFRFLAPVTRQVFETTFATLAELFGIYIMAGSMIVPGHDGRMMNTALLYGPDGQLIGGQSKVHLFPLEERWGICCSHSLKVYGTPVGNLAFPICMDATYWETFRILRMMGADLVLVPVANPDQYNWWKTMRGVWTRVQESQLYGVTSCMVGNFLGVTLTGKSTHYAPLDLTPGGDGILAEAEKYNVPQLVTADFDYGELEKYRKQKDLFDGMNLHLYRKYIPDIYDGGEVIG